MQATNVVILAAGNGSRMKSDLPKVLHQVAGRAMVDWVVAAVAPLKPNKILTVTGVGAKQVQDHLAGKSDFVVQEQQLGTGHAVLQTKEALADNEGATLILSGDTPLFTTETLQALLDEHARTKNAVTVLTAFAENPTGYGRIVRGEDEMVLKIVEEKDASVTERRIQEINTGVYIFDNQLLFEALSQVGNDNVQAEYYLPDTLDILREMGQQIGAYQTMDFSESMGVNDRVALAAANKIMRTRINRGHMQNGVELIDPDNTYIDAGVQIGKDTVIEGNVTLKGKTVIGQDNVLTAGTRIEDSTIGDENVITSSHLEEALVENQTTIGPYAHLRPLAEIKDRAHLGNFVEVKKATVGLGSKVGHLSYVGNATLGADVNVGAGTIFVNYDGVNKFDTTVGDRVFIGSNTKIIAPVTLADESITAAGSTITDDVDFHQMGIARSRQTNKDDFWDRMPHKKG
ncbi:Bifunctional protein GlmU [Fructobacillus tropaeoli]|uniref:bifunctional UDP-N-acetylglucosamine diphosphorylase/glucosamine-1-phosphate N-acetyltransferase GlmU n=1 Tax=Fructobacillus tropaeoli TaxID=709323 RepID=UPI0014560D45|nr:bifunctional UDP-N-acetylglucosamine diphosphorylase/glucosamine-1-phosphate N-acetyltransferase GlmU [Fructobacillus tropaeoli]NLS37521.1 bifunctional UDP-N-acetylglucosamine diphosphorylase/glucosamine-1-phosphate N-acetyltransferase GlmU [Fructobacillus tropaeoli]CAK1237256.1 Bifunctional protein GlmU [Fructobacillus tropaeoli]